jgi:superfamily II DNA/RNA helicase
MLLQIKAADTSKWMREPRTLEKWHNMIKNASPSMTAPNWEDPVSALTYLIDGSPKLRILALILGEVVFKNDKKLIIWVSFPAEQILLYHFLQRFKLDAGAITADLSQKERRAVQRAFNEDKNRCRVLVCSYAINSCGLNLQSMCNHVVLWNPPLSDPIAQQAVGRSRRIGQRYTVLVYELFVQKSFNEKQLSHNLAKALPGVMAELNTHIFNGHQGDIEEDREEGRVGLGQWIISEGKLISRVEAEAKGVLIDKAKLLTPEQLIYAIMNEMKGEVIVA